MGQEPQGPEQISLALKLWEPEQGPPVQGLWEGGGGGAGVCALAEAATVFRNLGILGMASSIVVVNTAGFKIGRGSSRHPEREEAAMETAPRKITNSSQEAPMADQNVAYC